MITKVCKNISKEELDFILKSEVIKNVYGAFNGIYILLESGYVIKFYHHYKNDSREFLFSSSWRKVAEWKEIYLAQLNKKYEEEQWEKYSHQNMIKEKEFFLEELKKC